MAKESKAKHEADEDEENGRRREKYELLMRRQMRAEHAVWIAGGNVRSTSRCPPRSAMDVGRESLLAPPRKICEAQERTKVLVWDAGHARKDVSLATAEAGEIVTRCAAPQNCVRRACIQRCSGAWREAEGGRERMTARTGETIMEGDVEREDGHSGREGQHREDEARRKMLTDCRPSSRCP